MSKQLYEEALADVKKLKEVAEDNAKRALLEAVTPRIRDLIENQLLGELSKSGPGETDLDQIMFDECGDTNLTSPMPSGASWPTESQIDPMSVAVAPAADVVVMTDSSDDDLSAEEDEDALDASDVADDMGKMMSMKLEAHVKSFESNLVNLSSRIKDLAALKESQDYDLIISEVQDMYVYLQTNLQKAPNKTGYEKLLENFYSTLKQLTEQKMMKKNRNLLEDLEITLKVPLEDEEQEAALQAALDSAELVVGEEEGEEGEVEGLGGEEEEESDLEDLGSEEGEEEESDEEDSQMESHKLSDNVIVEIDESMLRSEIKRMRALREENETKAQSWGHGAGDVADGFEDEDMGDPFVDIELTTEGVDDLDEVEMTDQGYGMDQGYGVEEGEEAGMLDELELDQASGDNVAPKSMGPGAGENKQSRIAGETVPVTNESLRREARIQTAARAKATTAKKLCAEAARKGDKVQARKLNEAFKFFARKFNESVARTNKIKGMLAEAAAPKGRAENGRPTVSAVETTNLRAKLAETNLFNAKLLFTNKLLQNESLTKRQKAEVIERLDEAKTEREVRLVYESVTKSLQGSPARRMTESTDRGVIGSASRPTRPASTNLNEGFEADRWAKLAGIK